ncbi:MAG: hypothetical protein U1F58_15105 [Burkholderiales bacterium]
MNTLSLRAFGARVLIAVAAAVMASAPAYAARIGILTNKYAPQTAADFSTNVGGHTFTPIDTSVTIPTLASLTGAFDAILVFEDATFGNATAVGNVAAAYANSGRPVVLGAFYDQDRSDAPAVNSPHGWGALEQIDPNTTDGTGTPYTLRTLDTATLARHPLTAGLNSLTSAKFAGGNQPKPGTTVVAWWKQPNALGKPDPAIAYRITGPACVIQVAIAPNYPSIPNASTDYSGDFHRAWKNAFDFAGAHCVASTSEAAPPDVTAVPTLSPLGLALTVLLVGAGAGTAFRRGRRAR